MILKLSRPLIVLALLMVMNPISFTQGQFNLEGQASLLSSYTYDQELYGFAGIRYLPKTGLIFNLDTTNTKRIDFEASINMEASGLFSLFDRLESDGKITPYRLWARYSSQQFELRVGLQKIDFGSASLLRPIQWFNQIDPRDPLQLTNGVYGVLGRYYFLNNANIWIWTLFGNDRTRGLDLIETNNKRPEFGGRIQLPTKKGELAFSYHYRTANSTNQFFVPQFEQIPEHRFAIDGKWDYEVGIWFEASAIHKRKNLDGLTNQALFNLGVDYTVGVGNGINIIVEHLTTLADQSFLGTENTANITGATISYPFGFFDSFSSVYLYNWSSKDVILNMIYNHEFENISGYIMAYYNPDIPVGFQQNDLVNQFSGAGIRILLVYNH